MNTVTIHDKPKTNSSQCLAVHFQLADLSAKTVSVVGTFNEWLPESQVLSPGIGGLWHGEIALAPGVYEYCFVVDGRWVADPSATESVPNCYGGKNSVLRVALSEESTHLADAENIPFVNTNQSNP